MGNVHASYKSRRGTHEGGSEINNGKDWFKNFIEEDFDNVKPMYENLSAA